MKLAHRFFLLTALATMLLFATAGAVQRTVVFEDFTNWSCGPCAQVNPGFRTVLNSMTTDTVIAIAYHVWWPGANDAFYLWNTAEISSRVNYYGVNAVPAIFVDGVTSPNPSSQTAIRSAIRQRYAIASPATIELGAFVAGETSIGFSGTVTAESGMNNSTTRLFVVLITEHVTYSSPPGTNGETFFPHIFRDFWPSASGQLFTLEAGETLDFEGTLNRNASWDPDSLRVMAFIQTTSNREFLQSAEVHVDQYYGARMETADAHQSIEPTNAEQSYELTLQSIGLNEDTYTATLSGELPAGWTRTVEAVGVTPNSNEIDITLDGQASTTLTIRVNPNGYPGSADLELAVSSANMPSLNLHDSFRHMAGLEILIVDDDGGETYETFYEEGLTAALAAQQRTLPWGVWNVNRDALDAALDGVELVIWGTGATPNNTSLSEADILLLSDYLDNGGNLFLFSQGAGFDLRQTTFYSSYLHATYTGNHAWREIEGLSGDPIGDNLHFYLGTDQGGDGIPQSRQHSVSPLDGMAASSLLYSGHTNTAALRVETGTFKVFYAGFGFEGIGDADSRTGVMARGLDWIFPQDAENPGDPFMPQEFALGQNFPNPFNPTTVIPFALPVRTDVRLSVFDILGREVAVLVNGMTDAGVHAVEFNGVDLSSGVYFYRLETSEFRATHKLVLMK
ncbi:Omp28-related outer membrane protein [candidate division KSB1 bacterium]|nr:Omp28-related outer membrane protein [candidate division KSB1 bacterium]